ncbi:MAG: hypothetical protein AABX66_03890 [Nanoarchaeota archaeon]
MNELCSRCGKESKRFTRGVCHNCYRKYLWEQPKSECKRCHRMKTIQAWGLCSGCYNSIFHVEKVKIFNRKKLHNISNEVYKKITSKCVICGFEKIVDLHHLDHNHLNNSEQNLIGLCPNHHRMLHNRTFTSEILDVLKQRGYSSKTPYESDDLFKANLIGTIHKNKLKS